MLIYLDRQEPEMILPEQTVWEIAISFALVLAGLVGAKGKFGYSAWKAGEEFDDGTDLTIGSALGPSLILPC